MDFNQLLLLIIFLLVLSIICIGGLIFVYTNKTKGKRASLLPSQIQKEYKYIGSVPHLKSQNINKERNEANLLRKSAD